MRFPHKFVLFIAIALQVLQCGPAAVAQEESRNNLSEGNQTSQSSLTGAGVGSSSTTAAMPGGADGLGNPFLGGSHSLYRLQHSDVVDVTFTLAPEFNQILTVQPDGFVALKDAGMVRAEGLNLQEFLQAVRKAYSGYLHDPLIAVALKDFERPYFVVGGEVGHPGKYQLRRDTTVAEAVEIAGGMTSDAKHSQVVLFRRVDDNLVEARLLNLKKMLRNSGLKEDAHLQPGDMVFVPKSTISKIARYLSRPSLSMYMSPAQF
jgi:polysaccharide export outer membrane protein